MTFSTEIKKQYDIVKRLESEITSTENLLLEGDPFLMNRREYLDNLKYIRGDLEKTLNSEGSLK